MILTPLPSPNPNSSPAPYPCTLMSHGPQSSYRGARNCLAWLLENATAADVSNFPTSSLLGSAGALEMGARARSAPLGRSQDSKWPLEPARLRRSARNGCSSPLGSAGRPEVARGWLKLWFKFWLKISNHTSARTHKRIQCM